MKPLFNQSFINKNNNKIFLVGPEDKIVTLVVISKGICTFLHPTKHGYSHDRISSHTNYGDDGCIWCVHKEITDSIQQIIDLFMEPF